MCETSKNILIILITQVNQSFSFSESFFKFIDGRVSKKDNFTGLLYAVPVEAGQGRLSFANEQGKAFIDKYLLNIRYIIVPVKINVN